jgi:hypothetical protein
MVLERTIHDLLYGHDCVIVPGFGGFLTHYRGARLDTRQRMIMPPGKDLSFNRKLTRTDGLLAQEVARLTRLGHEASNRLLETTVEAWRVRLDRDGRLELAQLGTFFLDAERNLQFEADRHVNHLKDAFGLRPVTAVPVVRAVPAPEPVILELEPATKREAAEERRSNVLWAAAAFTAILFAAATWVMVERNGQSAHWSGLGVFGPAEPLSYLPREADAAAVEVPVDGPFLLPDTGSGLQRFELDGPGSPELIVDMGPLTVVPESTAVAVREEAMRFHVIGGCFSVKENADHYQEALRAKGFSPVLVDVKGGLYRVALGSYPQRAMALEALDAARTQEAPEAWLLVK